MRKEAKKRTHDHTHTYREREEKSTHEWILKVLLLFGHKF